jgi:hypothetical protein
MVYGFWKRRASVSTACLGGRRSGRRAPNPCSLTAASTPRPPPLIIANLQFVRLGPRPSAREGTCPKFVDATTPPHLKIRPSSSTSTKARTHGAAGSPAGRPLAGLFPFNCRVTPELNLSIHWTALSVSVPTYRSNTRHTLRDPLFFLYGVCTQQGSRNEALTEAHYCTFF